DQMLASVSIPEEFASIWIPERIQEGLQRQGVVGIDTEILPEVTQHPDVLYPVATGKEPESGKDAEVVDELGLTEVAGKPTERSDRSVNMKELNFIKNVNQGQVLMRKNPVQPGVPGVNVFGEPIPCREGEDVEFPSIPNAELSEDGYSLVSTINGCAYKEGNQLHLVSTFEVQKNVDYSIGNIDASVAVHVNGDVLTGFRVESREDIIVKGTTEGCHLLSRGNIFLPGGVQGKEEAIIRAKKNVDAKFFNEANVTAGGAVIVHGAVILSRIRCQRLALEGNDAVIKGGEIEAAIDVCADSIGSDIGSKTKITLGHDLRELEDKLETLAEDIQNAGDRLQRFEESRENLRKMQEKNGYLPPDKEKLKEKVESSLAQAQERLEEKETNREKKQIELENARQIVRTVRVRKKIMPGVEIDILGHSISFKTPTDPVTVIVIDDEIQVVPFQERSFEEADEMDIE
ncbi:DUF342 domain-containing protein, partial [bacterium]|nr:DUF342 domain-containing protein [bacterium]